MDYVYDLPIDKGFKLVKYWIEHKTMYQNIYEINLLIKSYFNIKEDVKKDTNETESLETAPKVNGLERKIGNQRIRILKPGKQYGSK